MKMPSDVWKRYVAWVDGHPEGASELESVVKWIAYGVSVFLRQSKNSLVITELLYKSGQFLGYINDRAFEELLQDPDSPLYSRIEQTLGFLEAAEVILELSGSLAGGTVGKWAVVVVVQLIRCACRLLLLHRQRRRILQNPTMISIKRNQVLKRINDVKRGGRTTTSGLPSGVHKDEGPSAPSEDYYELPRSGRRIRRIRGAPKVFQTGNCRPKNIRGDDGSSDSEAFFASQMGSAGGSLLGEVAYAVQPLAQLAAASKYGLESWRPWLVSAACDGLSHGLHHHSPSSSSSSSRGLSPGEKKELARRRMALLRYLLRSPFYDAVTKRILGSAVEFAERNVPFGGTVAGLAFGYLPHYRGIYSYLWSN